MEEVERGLEGASTITRPDWARTVEEKTLAQTTAMLTACAVPIAQRTGRVTLARPIGQSTPPYPSGPTKPGTHSESALVVVKHLPVLDGDGDVLGPVRPLVHDLR